jgi:hypothetical protein
MLMFSILFAGLLSSSSAAGVEDRYLASLKAHGYRCADTSARDGYACTSGITYVTVPKNLTAHTHNVFYAHGLVGVCGNGGSGENYLRNESPTLRRIGAISIMPLRRNAADTGFPLASDLRGVETALGGESVPLIVAGHSAAGSFLGSELAANPGVAKRVDQALLIDAIYGQSSTSSWLRVLALNPAMRVHLVSSTTYAASKTWVRIVQSHFPAAVSLEREEDGHCQMPKYFRELR